MTKAAEHKKKTARWNKTYHFAREVIGNPVIVPQPHWEMCGFVDQVIDGISPVDARLGANEQQKAMMLVPRGCVKTGVSIAAVIKLFTRYPNARVLLDGAFNVD